MEEPLEPGELNGQRVRALWRDDGCLSTALLKTRNHRSDLTCSSFGPLSPPAEGRRSQVEPDFGWAGHGQGKGLTRPLDVLEIVGNELEVIAGIVEVV